MSFVVNLGICICCFVWLLFIDGCVFVNVTFFVFCGFGGDAVADLFRFGLYDGLLSVLL